MVIASKAKAVMKNGKLRKGFTSKEVTMKNGTKRTMYFDTKARGKSKPKKVKKEVVVSEPAKEPEPMEDK